MWTRHIKSPRKTASKVPGKNGILWGGFPLNTAECEPPDSVIPLFTFRDSCCYSCVPLIMHLFSLKACKSFSCSNRVYVGSSRCAPPQSAGFFFLGFCCRSGARLEHISAQTWPPSCYSLGMNGSL